MNQAPSCEEEVAAASGQSLGVCPAPGGLPQLQGAAEPKVTPGVQTTRAHRCHVGQLLQVVLYSRAPAWLGPVPCQVCGSAGRFPCSPAQLALFTVIGPGNNLYPKLHLSVCCLYVHTLGSKHKLSGPRSAGAIVELTLVGGQTASRR